MQKMLRALAYIDLILGTIGSIVLAKDLGRTADIYLSGVYYERDWILTICIFFGCFFGVLVLFAVLFSVAEILDAQERLMARLIENKSSIHTNLQHLHYIHLPLTHPIFSVRVNKPKATQTFSPHSCLHSNIYSYFCTWNLITNNYKLYNNG